MKKIVWGKWIGVLLLGVVLLAPSFSVRAESVSGVQIYGSSTEDKCFYERAVVLSNGDILATWCREFPVVTGWTGMKSLYFYKSSDDGKTWTQVSTLDPSDYNGLSRDKMGMSGMYVLPRAVGNLPAGTILFALSDWDTSSEYCIHIWRSTDQGVTWQLHSNLAPRGNVTSSVWEPEFILTDEDKLICYYSDERQPGYDQCIAEEISLDGGITWSDYQIIVGTGDPNWVRGVDPSMWRPGMPRVIQMSNGSYFMAYENIANGYGGIISCRTSQDGINWGDVTALGTRVQTSDAQEAHQCPMIACIDDGSTYGRIVLRGMNDTCSPSKCFTSVDGGNTWQLMDAPLTAVRKEAVGSSWSGTFLTKGTVLFEINNIYNDSYNEIRCNTGVLAGENLFVSGAEYVLENAASGYCVDDAGGSLDWGNELIVWNKNGLDTQSWKLEKLTADYFAINCKFSGLNMDNPSGSMIAGQRIVQWDVNGSDAQSWRLLDAGNGTYRIQNQKSQLYLDTENHSTAVHANLVQANYDNISTQKWYVQRLFDTVRLRSANISDCNVYHGSDGKVLIANDSTQMVLKSSQWKVVKGLADENCISLESVDWPGYYLRHYNGNIIISQNDGTELFAQDATWRLQNALNGGSGNSLESYNYPGNYIRHYNSYLKISTIGSDIDRNDASFLLQYQ